MIRILSSGETVGRMRSGQSSALIPSARQAAVDPSVTFAEAGSDTGYTWSSFSPYQYSRINMNLAEPGDGFLVSDLVTRTAGRWISGKDMYGSSDYPMTGTGVVWASWVPEIGGKPGYKIKLKIYGPTVGLIATYPPSAIWCKQTSWFPDKYYEPGIDVQIPGYNFGPTLSAITPDDVSVLSLPTDSDTHELEPTVAPSAIDTTWGECSMIAFWPGMKESDFAWS